MQDFTWSLMTQTQRQAALSRPAAISDHALLADVREIMDRIRDHGDAALLDYTLRFDGVKPQALQADPAAMKAAWDALSDYDKAAIDRARANITAFHKAQIPSTIDVETQDGVFCRREPRAIERAGLYVPGGTAPLVSTLLMLAVPAKIAGVSERIIVTPPDKNGQVNPVILAAAYRCEVTSLYICGGAQAIAALAYGTQTIPKCDKIFGPGNAWVAAAKSLAAQEAGGPAIDMPAGPSEAMVICDEMANAQFVASDLLSQAEHDRLAQVICVASSETIAHSVKSAITAQIESLPRKDIAKAALEHARFFIASRDNFTDIINAYAPEHLILQIQNPEQLVPDIRHVGSIFLGPWTPESVGDYASGTNHTLPTFGAARAYSGVTLESFIKYISVQRLTEKGIKELGPYVERLAQIEGLEAHKRAVTFRLEALKAKAAS